MTVYRNFVDIEATPEQVWPFLADFPKMLEWFGKNSPVLPPEKIEQLDPTTWLASAADGQQATIAIMASEPGQRLSYQVMQHNGAPLNMSQRHEFDLDIIEGGTSVTWTVDYELSGGRFLPDMVLKFTAAQQLPDMVIYSLDNLKDIVEESTNEKDKPDIDYFDDDADGGDGSPGPDHA